MGADAVQKLVEPGEAVRRQCESTVGRVDVPAQDPLVGRPEGVSLQHFLHGGRFLPIRMVGGYQRTKNGIDCFQGSPHYFLLVRSGLRHEKEVDGRNRATTSARCSGSWTLRACGERCYIAVGRRCSGYLFEPVPMRLKVALAISHAVSVRTVKNGGDSTYPIGRASGKAISGGCPGVVGRTTPNLGMS